MRPAVQALSAYFDVTTFSLPRTPTLEGYLDRVVAALHDAPTERVVVCGVSFGGIVAAKFAAVHPDRVLALVLASTPAPGWHLSPRHEMYARLPWLFGPLFLIETPWRMRAELQAAIPDRRGRLRFKLGVLRTAIGAPISFGSMADRARLMERVDLRADCGRIGAPTLVVTGEAALDHVVPAEGSSEYARLIPGARAAVLERTGHVGTVTRPATFAALVHDFVRDTCGASAIRSEPGHPRSGAA